MSAEWMKTFIALILKSRYFPLSFKRKHWYKDTDASFYGASQFMQ